MIDNIIPRTMENTRKCIKCGRSPAKDNVKLFRFPKPGVTNLIRCTLWAKYIFPEKEYASIDFQKKMHTEHRMLCHLHFKDADFGDESRTKLLRTSIPCDKESDSASHSQQNPFCDISNFASVAPQKQKKETKLMTKPSSTASDRENLNPEAGPSAGLLAGPSAGPSAGLLARPSDQQTKHNALLVKCRKYMQKVCQLRNRIKCLKQKDVIKVIDEERAVKKLSEKITPAFALLLQGQIRNFKKKITGRRWSKEEKITALRIYKRSPTCYRLLRRLFPLPSPSSLKTLLRRLPIGVGINKPVFNVLKRFTETQNPKDNYYTLLFDEMSLKKQFQYNEKDDIIEGYQDHGTQGRSPVAAGYALVFMVSGIRKKFKQPVAHYFSSGFSTADRLAVLIKEVLNECFEAGLNIVAIVCDMDGVNRRALNILGSSVQNPRIEINNREIITLFDTPHLLKCFRNLFMKYNIEINTNISSDGKAGKCIAKWAHIKEFHELDSVNPNFVYAPVLKAEHLNPNSKQKMKVNLAAQVLSHSVAGGMFARISNGEMSAEAIITANLVAEMDKLFDLLNAESPDLRRGKPFSTNWSKTSPHQKYLEKIKNFFETLRFVGSPRRPPSQDGWLTTINGFLKLKRKLEADNITSSATRRIQQDPIENLFGCIRGNCGSNTNPTCGQFVAGLKTAVLSNLSHMGTTGNCETDSNVIINNFNTFLSASQPAKQIIESKLTAEGMPQIRDEDVVENSEVQACAYVCGFIVKKMKNINCSICRNIFLAQAVGPEHLFVESREYNEQKQSLNYVTKALIASVESCANFVNTILKENGHEHNLRQNIKESMKTNIDFVFLNACVEHKQSNTEHIINSVFMICTKRFCVLKNRSFSREASAAALQRKMKIILHE